MNLYWLPELADWNDRFRSASASPNWQSLVGLANTRVDMLRTNRLDKLLRQAFFVPPTEIRSRPVRLAVLSSSTVDHLTPAIRVAALRRNLWLDVFIGDYGQYFQELVNEDSALYVAAPDTILFAFDAEHFFGSADAGMTNLQANVLIDQAADRIADLWRLARERLGCHVIQQTLLPRFPALAGANEHRLDGSRANLVAQMNMRLRRMADTQGADLLALDSAAAQSGLSSWYDAMLWHRAKLEISPVAAPLYGDLVVRLIAARRGLSFKCLVLDLDNTLWGGVIGDDGLEGIQLGQGSALGEAFVAFQRYCRDLSRRGVILAVCSKNQEINAQAPFENHPEMILRTSDIACFIANWEDKPRNIRTIAERLNIGIDAIAFADDNPFERALVRRELPTVAVPELPEDPALYAGCIADAGYFETVRVTDDDYERAQQYQANLKRERVRETSTDIAGYLRSLDMRLSCAAFDAVGLSRIVQLINKTNQFNLTTRRYGEMDVRRLMDDPKAITMQFRLADQLGDNGMICIVIGRIEPEHILLIDTWLMSCRVLGRNVEEATMNILADAASRRSVNKIVGEYLPTPKNSIVREHYGKLGFRLVEEDSNGRSRWERDLCDYAPFSTFITVE